MDAGRDGSFAEGTVDDAGGYGAATENPVTPDHPSQRSGAAKDRSRQASGVRSEDRRGKGQRRGAGNPEEAARIMRTT